MRKKTGFLSQLIQELRLRKQSEVANQKLRVLLCKQTKLSNEVHALLVRAMSLVETQVVNRHVVDARRKSDRELSRCFNGAI